MSISENIDSTTDDPGHWLQCVVDRFASRFTDSLISIYLIGSYVDGSAIPSSDIDGFIIFDAEHWQSVHDEAKRVLQELRQESSIWLDFALIDTSGKTRYIDLSKDARFHLGSRLVWGEDIRHRYDFPKIGERAPRILCNCLARIALTRKLDTLPEILSYPDPKDTYYGYVSQSNLAREPSPKAAVQDVCWYGNAILAMEHRVSCGSRMQVIEGMLKHEPDGLGRFLWTLHDTCKIQWHWRMPEGSDAVSLLSDLCSGVLSIEERISDLASRVRPELPPDMAADYDRLLAARMGE